MEKVDIQEAIKMREIGQKHPEIWIPQVLNFVLFKHQEEIVKSVFRNKYTAVRSCSGIGKSRIAAATVIDFLYNFFLFKGYADSRELK